MFTNSGRHIQISGRRYCRVCQTITDQVCHKIRYQGDGSDDEGALVKKSYWICSACVSESKEVKVQPLPGDKVRIINRLLRMQDDYAIRSMKITSRSEGLIIKIAVDDSGG